MYHEEREVNVQPRLLYVLVVELEDLGSGLWLEEEQGHLRIQYVVLVVLWGLQQAEEYGTCAMRAQRVVDGQSRAVLGDCDECREVAVDGVWEGRRALRQWDEVDENAEL